METCWYKVRQWRWHCIQQFRFGHIGGQVILLSLTIFTHLESFILLWQYTYYENQMNIQQKPTKILSFPYVLFIIHSHFLLFVSIRARLSFVMSVRLSAWNNSVSTGRILMKVDTLVFFENTG
jgi:hypothetical protein